MSKHVLTNHEVKVPGTTVTACLGRWSHEPERWIYTLWSGDEPLVDASGEWIGDTLSFPGLDVTPGQVARVAFLLSVEYAESGS